MNYARRLGALAVAAVALMLLAGSASATTLTHGNGEIVVPGEEIRIWRSSSQTLDGTINISCAVSNMFGEVSNAGGFGGHVQITLFTLNFAECGNHTIEVKKPGSLSIESVGGGKGTIRSTGAEITALTHSLFLGTRHCIYVTNNTHLGSITGGTTPYAIFDSAPIPQSTTDSLCGNDAEWTGSYEVYDPDTLLID